MNCQQFTDALNECLDRRVSPGCDRRLQRHAEHCGVCRDQLETWGRIETALAPRNPSPAVLAADRCQRGGRGSWPDARGRRRGREFHITFAAASLAAVLVITLAWPDGAPRAEPPAAGPRSLAAASAGADRPLRAGPALVAEQWWQRLGGQEWVDRTVPAMRSVRDGVAPLGRSFIQAVAILAGGGGTRAS